MSEEYKMVHFHEYCNKCKHWKENDEGVNEPCNECLDNPTNLNSHMPVKFEEKGK